MSQTIRKVSPE